METPDALHYSPGISTHPVIMGQRKLWQISRKVKGRIRSLEEGWHYSADEYVDVTVTGVRVHDISLAGSGSANLSGLDLDHMHLVVAGNFQVNAQGRADDVDLSIAGGGRADMQQLAGKRPLHLHIIGGNDVWLSPRDQAIVSITGSAHVYMAAKPTNLSQTVLGSGRVTYPSVAADKFSLANLCIVTRSQSALIGRALDVFEKLPDRGIRFWQRR